MVFRQFTRKVRPKKALSKRNLGYFFKITSFFKKTTRRRQYHQSKLNFGDYPVAYVDYPVAHVDYPVAYVEYPVTKKT